MLVKKNKILVHFTNDISLYSLNENTLNLLSEEHITFEESFMNEILLEKINRFLDNLKECAVVINDEYVRLYATGIIHFRNQKKHGNS